MKIIQLWSLKEEKKKTAIGILISHYMSFFFEKVYMFNFTGVLRRISHFRKVMTNLDSIFKSRDITLPTKVRLVKAMVCPVVMCGCESWTVKKAEHRRIDVLKCGVGEDS